MLSRKKSECLPALFNFSVPVLPTSFSTSTKRYLVAESLTAMLNKSEMRSTKKLLMVGKLKIKYLSKTSIQLDIII